MFLVKIWIDLGRFLRSGITLPVIFKSIDFDAEPRLRKLYKIDFSVVLSQLIKN